MLHILSYIKVLAIVLSYLPQELCDHLFPKTLSFNSYSRNNTSLIILNNNKNYKSLNKTKLLK
jgi:hypothetical protein